MSEPNTCTITLPAHMDLAASERILADILAQQGTASTLDLDMQHVTEMSTPALQMLLSASGYTPGIRANISGANEIHRQMFTQYGVWDELLGVISA